MARFIIIGDIHGCAQELQQLLDKLSPTKDDVIISLGDVTDKGPDSVEAIKILMRHGAVMVDSNHDNRYKRYFKKGFTSENVSAKNIKESYKTEYEKLWRNQTELAWLAKSAPYLEVEFGGKLFTFVHAGVVPYIDLYNMQPWQIGESLRVRYLDADTGKFIRMVKIDKDKYPDEVASWRPEHNNVIEWQKAYNGNYGIVVHGHIIVGPGPMMWFDTPHGTEKFSGSADNQDKSYSLSSMLKAGLKVISLDTGAHKGWNLTALVLDMNDETISFERVEVNICYEP